MLGRFISGLGGEIICVLNAVYASQWFFDQELSLAMAVAQFCNFISYFSGNTVPGIGAKYGLAVALGVGALANIGSFLVSCVVVSVDNYA